MNKKVIVTILIGKGYLKNWKKNCKKNWEIYAKKYGYDLVVFDDYLDKSKRALSRSPAWQKCLILEQKKIEKYGVVVWLDADIIINNNLAPDVCESVPNGLIGGVDMWDTPSRAGAETALIRAQQINKFLDKNFESSYVTARDYYQDYGFKKTFNNVLQTGVMVLSKKHKKILSKVYAEYEDKGDSQWHYEMRPLTYEIMKNKLACFVDSRFNAVVGVYLLLNYPFELGNKTIISKVLSKFGINYLPKSTKDAIWTIYSNNYFIHFAGGINIYTVDQNINKFLNKKFRLNKIVSKLLK